MRRLAALLLALPLLACLPGCDAQAPETPPGTATARLDDRPLQGTATLTSRVLGETPYRTVVLAFSDGSRLELSATRFERGQHRFEQGVTGDDVLAFYTEAGERPRLFSVVRGTLEIVRTNAATAEGTFSFELHDLLSSCIGCQPARALTGRFHATAGP